MKIGYFGDGIWAYNALDKIKSNSTLEIVFIVGRFDNPDPVLESYAKKLSVPYLLNCNVNSQDFYNQIKEYNADIFVSMSFDQIVRKQLMNATPLGFINCHAGALPFYRGRNILNWALINGESSFGITVHYIDEGIDTGDIILQKLYEISLEDNYSTLLRKAYDYCGDLLLESLVLIQKGEVKPIKQKTIHPVGFYCGRRRLGDEWIDWNWSSERIYNFIRGISPPAPGARTFIDDKQIAILSAYLINDAPEYIGYAGEIVGKCKDGVIVKTGTSTIKITAIADILNGTAILESKIPKFSIGNRLGLNLWLKISELEFRLKHLEDNSQI